MQPLSKREPLWLARLFVDKHWAFWTCCCITWFHGVLCWKGGSPAICIKVSDKVLQGQKYQETIINFECVPLWKVRKLMNETQILGSPSMDLIPNNQVNLLPYISWQLVASFAASFFEPNFGARSDSEIKSAVNVVSDSNLVKCHRTACLHWIFNPSWGYQ